MFGKFFKKKLTAEQEEKREEEWYDEKSIQMETILGKEHDMVMHAIIPYDLGGALDLYYYPNDITGTAIATKELANACRESSSNDKFKKYELVMFTKHQLDLDDAQKVETTFGKAHLDISQILNPIARYSEQAKLNPNETSEFPKDFENIGGKCLMFCDYGSKKDQKEDFGIMLIIEVFREEMEFARQKGREQLIQLLKDNDILT